MGWGAAGNIFDDVADALIDNNVHPGKIRAVCAKLIADLTEQDWSTQADSLDRHAAHADKPAHMAVIEAFADNDHHRSYCDAQEWYESPNGRVAQRTCRLAAGHPGKHHDGVHGHFGVHAPDPVPDPAREPAPDRSAIAGTMCLAIRRHNQYPRHPCVQPIGHEGPHADRDTDSWEYHE